MGNKIEQFSFSKDAQKHSKEHGVAISIQTGYELIRDVATDFTRITVWSHGEVISTTKTYPNGE